MNSITTGFTSQNSSMDYYYDQIPICNDDVYTGTDTHVSPIDEQLLWQTTAAAWFVAMIISLISTLTQHGNKKDDTTE